MFATQKTLWLRICGILARKFLKHDLICSTTSHLFKKKEHTLQLQVEGKGRRGREEREGRRGRGGEERRGRGGEGGNGSGYETDARGKGRAVASDAARPYA